jgi:hypothetical protein
MPNNTPDERAIVPASQPTDSAEPVKWLVGGAAGCLLFVLTIMFIGAALTAGTVGGGVLLLRSAMGSVFAVEPPTGSVTTSQTIVTQVRPLGQLISTSGGFAKADIGVSIQQGAFGSCNHSANHVAAATITAGIDLYKINENAVTYDAATDTYTLIVPRPVITGCSMDFIDQYERNLNVPTCGVDWDDARQIAQYEGMVSLRNDAMAGGLLETAERQTEFALTSFITALTGSNVIIEFEEELLTTHEAYGNCNPQPPRDWTFDESVGQWIQN